VIGLLVNSVFDGYEEEIWKSVVAAADEFDADLLCYLGGALAYDRRSTALFDLVHPDNVDGLVVVAGSVGWFTGAAEVAAKLARIGDVPAVSLSEPLGAIPRLVVENGAGIAKVVEHLASHHGCRRIGFVGGPPRNSDAAERLEGYREGLARAGLPFDEARVVVGDYLRASAREGLRTLFDERRLDLDAVVAANDMMALEIMDDLRRRGRSLPVCGFDDIADAASASPPLTTARQPLHEMAREAMRLVLAQLRGEEVPAVSRFPAQLVVRQSCGCSWLEDTSQVLGATASAAELAAALEARFPEFGPRIGHRTWASELASALRAGPRRGKGPFLEALERILARCLDRLPEPAAWIRVLRALVAVAPAEAAGRDEAATAALSMDAHALVASMATATQLARRVRSDEEARALRWLAQPFPVDEGTFTARLVEELQVLGVRSFFLSRYLTADQRDAALVAHFDLDGIVELEESPATFAPQRLVPGHFTAGRRCAHAVLPVSGPDGLIGFALCELGALSPASLEILMHQLSAVFSVNGLMAEVHEKHKQLLDAARQAGMAEVAVGALHNVGNLLTSVGVSAEEIRAAAGEIAGAGLAKAAALLAEHEADLPAFFSTDPRGRLLPTYLTRATGNLARSTEQIRAEALELLEKTGLVRESIRALQDFARGGQEHLLQETIELPVVVKAALEIQRAHLERHGVRVQQELDGVVPFVAQRSKLVHVLVNLVKNGVEAMRGVPEEQRLLSVRARQEDGRIRVDVQDAGEGISPEHRDAIFRYGFTTKRDGHGFGLHTCANYMKQMGGSITASSDGVGRGATFTLWIAARLRA
jgi:DNA-binding LacI/PurR family transcriptional regulator/signal transduction histidine kinase